MEIFKKILKWTGITLAIIFGIVLIVVILMSIFPNFTIFGYRFIAKSENPEPITYYVNLEEESIILANTNVFDIEITENYTYNKIIVSFEDNKWGFSNVDKSRLSIKQDLENKIIEARMLETNGLLIGTGVLKISIPKHYKCYLNLNTQNGNITIDKEYLLGLTANLNDGEISWSAKHLSYEPIEDESLNNPTDENTENEPNAQDADETPNDTPATETPEVTEPEELYSPLYIKDPEKYGLKEVFTPVEYMEIYAINIFCNNAKIDFSSFKTLACPDFFVSAKNLDFNFETLGTNNLNITCSDLKLNVKNLLALMDFNIVCDTGSINIQNFEAWENCNFTTTSCPITINQVLTETHIDTKSGNIAIVEAKAKIVAKTLNGDIKITYAEDNVNLDTTSGNITVSYALKDILITTDTGNINVKSSSEESNTININILTNSGNVDVVTENNKVSVTSINGSIINATIRNMCQNSNINHTIHNLHGTSNINVMVAEKPFKIRAVGTVSGELATNVIIQSNTEYVYYLPANYTDNPINVSSINAEGGNIHFTGIYE